MQRRAVLGVLVSTMFLSACGAARTSATSGSVLVAGLSARTVREIARVNGMLGLAPLPSQVRRGLQPGRPVPMDVAFHDIPAALLARLPVVEGHQWRIAGIDLLLVEADTMLIADILRGPFR